MNGTEYSVLGRDQIASVLPSIKKKFDTYSKFASKPFAGIISKDQLKDALILRATNFSSSYFENKGSGEFVIRSLPIQAQFSAVQSFYINDFNNDGNSDILLGGNFYSPDFMIGRYDASIGLLMLGDGKGNFNPVEQAVSGIHFTGDIRRIAPIKIGQMQSLIIGANQGKLELYDWKPN